MATRHMLTPVILAAVLALGAGGLVAPAASANTSGVITGPSTAFVSQWVTVTLAGASTGSATTASLVDTSTGQVLATQPVGALGAQATFAFATPTTPRIMVLQAQWSDGSSNTLPLQVTTVPTTTTISAPDTARIGTPTVITVLVQSQSPSTYAPTGSVVVRDISGATVTTMGLTRSANASGQSFAYWRWTPTTASTFTFQASYGGDGIATASTSPVDVVIATPSGNTISLGAPSTMTVGVPVLLTATVVPSTTQGSAGFTLNGQPISASVPFVNGVATFLWTPTAAGAATLGVSYTTNGGRSGSTSSPVTIVAGPVTTDVITLVQPGVGSWSPNGVYTLGNGTTFTFQATTLSGSAVTISESGPCQVSGLTLTIDTGTGQCNLSASSPGGPGYAPVTQGYTVSMAPGQQTAALAAPPSGRVNVGRTIRLQNPVQGTTNADQTVNWRITSGGNRCRLRFPANGAVNLQLQRAGQCRVVAQARAVPDTWQAFRLERTYTAR